MSLTILYVDDEEINLDLFKINFSKVYTVITSTSALEALEIIKNKPVDVLISDYKMAQMNGVELITQVKLFNSKIPCVLASGYNQDMLNIPPKSIDAYLVKPFKKDILFATIDGLEL